jgi:ADP-ribosylglycohydrolase
MRVSPVGWAFGTLDETLAEAARSAEVTHNHPEGIKGAQATASAMFLARHGESKAGIRS